MAEDFVGEVSDSSQSRLPIVRVILGAVAGVVLLAGGAAGGYWFASRDDKVPNAADIGFVHDMIDHHEQAILMSQLVRAGDVSPAIRAVADDVIASQRYELGMMDAWLFEWEVERGQPGRKAMAWMGHPVAVADMLGMASADDLRSLQNATGSAKDELFLRLMTEHHEGGVHMGEEAEARADHPSIRHLARQMALNQRREIRHMQTTQAAIASQP